jgi:hypothetical protein
MNADAWAVYIEFSYDINRIFNGGERMKTRYDLAGFSMRNLLDDGVLVFGEDARSAIPYPSDTEMLEQVRNMINTVRKHAVTANDDIHSADWLFLICQSLYWLNTGKIACKSKAALWAKSNFDFNWCNELDKAINIRNNPEESSSAENRLWLSGLGSTIQSACDTLAKPVF